MIALFTDYGLNGLYLGQVEAVLHRFVPGEKSSTCWLTHRVTIRKPRHICWPRSARPLRQNRERFSSLSSILVLFQLNFDIFRASQRRQDKAQPAGMARPCQGLQRRIGVAVWLPAGGPGSTRPRRCAACEGRAIPCAPRLALNHFPTR